MKNAAIFIMLSVFFGFLVVFLVGEQNPINTEKLSADLAEEGISTQSETIEYVKESIELGVLAEYVDFSTLGVVGVVFSAFVFCFSASILTFIDKFFFRKFYEQPDYKTIVRRSVFLVLVIDGIILLKIFLGFDPVINIVYVLIFIVVEWFLSQQSKQNLSESDKSH